MRESELRADLHLHTDISDGTLPPREMIRRAAAVGMSVVSITDHDTAQGVPEAQVAGEETGVTVIPGIELSTGGSTEVHLLAYGIAPADPRMCSFLEGELAKRRHRMRTMLERAAQLGMHVPAEEASDKSGRFMGRMNLARAMVARGYARNVAEAFEQYLNPGRPLYVPRERVEVSSGIALLRSYGAFVSLAHPGRLKLDEQTLAALMPGFVDAGLEGLEAYHASHTDADCARFARMASRYGLLTTGGSDCHGDVPGHLEIGAHLSAWRTVTEDVHALLARVAIP